MFYLQADRKKLVVEINGSISSEALCYFWDLPNYNKVYRKFVFFFMFFSITSLSPSPFVAFPSFFSCLWVMEPNQETKRGGGQTCFSKSSREGQLCYYRGSSIKVLNQCFLKSRGERE